MARTHARVKGKSGSTRPVIADLSFVTVKKADVEKLVLELAKEDVKPSMIGLVLRDSHGIPSIKKMTGKSVGKILEDNKISVTTIPEDLSALVVRAKGLKKHLEMNTRDTHNKRSLQLIEAKIRRLSKYYKIKGKVPSNWRMN
ncbi:MAG: 30S ribosomal protein S15 [Candidatus Woesearchaeota archaeon]|jgi:small subunit ribosomal protein S15|nr:30S ribosomal protein S15 [Candidatus Woesearchaeota archaeon]